MKKAISALLALSIIFALAACGSNGAQSNGSGQGTGSGQDFTNVENIDNSYIKDSVSIAVNTATTLIPWGTSNSTPGNYSVYEMLYECDAKGEMYPLLADATYEGTLMPGCDHEPGSGEYYIHIYDYIKDHNGNQVTASDVAFSFNYQFNNESVSGWGDFITAEAESDTVVVLKFTEEQSGLGELTNILCRCFIVDEESYNNSASKLATEMCGTGPYKFSKYVSGSSLTLVRNEEYWQTNAELRRQEQQANVKEIVYQFINESAQKVVSLRTGMIDIVDNMEATAAMDFGDSGKYGENYNLFVYQAKFVNYLNCNCAEESICNDLNMRLAIYYAVDRDDLVAALGGTETKLPAYATPYYSDYYMVDWESLENYNTYEGGAIEGIGNDRAEVVKYYLDKAGYNGETLTLVSTGENEATVVAALLKSFEINAEVKALDFSSFNNAVDTPEGWDMMMGMMAGDYNVTVWQHGFAFANENPSDHTDNFVYNQDWEDLLNLCLTGEGHTAENMQAWWQMAVDNGYCMGLFAGNTYTVVPADMTYVCQGDKLSLLPGACCYANPNA